MLVTKIMISLLDFIFIFKPVTSHCKRVSHPMNSVNDRISVFAQVKVDIVLEISSNTKHVRTVSKKTIHEHL